MDLARVELQSRLASSAEMRVLPWSAAKATLALKTGMGKTDTKVG